MAPDTAAGGTRTLAPLARVVDPARRDGGAIGIGPGPAAGSGASPSSPSPTYTHAPSCSPDQHAHRSDRNESAGKRRSTRLRKSNVWLESQLVQAAWAAVKKKDSYPDHFDRRSKRKNANHLVRRLEKMGFAVTITPAAGPTEATFLLGHIPLLR